ncbi:general substrate transporter [Aspergillus ambiguus]|uniref:general substrate transporter n=1 Tax=Aspergillus ambiguus TaxID=176160 RepID=UPI003CCD57EB
MNFLVTLAQQFKTNRRAMLYCTVSFIGALVFGYDNTYYNGVLAMQELANDYGTRYDANGNKALAPSFQSLTTSSVYIGDALGAMTASWLNDKWGRKGAFWVASGFSIAGGIAQVSDTHYEGVLVLGRILIGIGVGQFTATSLLYCGEVAPVEIRGPVLNLYQLLQSVSQLVASCITQGTEGIPTSLSYKLPMGGLVILPLVMVCVLPFVPESPLWYVLKGRPGDAKASLYKINKSIPNYSHEADMAALDKIKRSEEHQAEASSWKALIMDPVERRKLITSSGALFSQQICGILYFYSFGVIVALSIGMKQPFLIQLITNIIQVFAVIACVVTSNKVRKRTSLLITTIIMFFTFIIIGGCGTTSITTPTRFVMVIVSYVNVTAYNFSLGPLTYGIAREMAVGANQNKIMSVSVVVLYVSAWLITFTAPYLYYTANLGPMLGFIYAGTTLLSLLWVWFCAGETTGRTSIEIGQFFERRIPVRQWESYVFTDEIDLITEKDNRRPSCKEDVEHKEATSV